jgi:glycosyltransferase involved in cell wall biosynthesis
MPSPRKTAARKALLIAFHFPPFKGSSGIERTLGFCRALPQFEWWPVVLSAAPRAYPAVSDDRMSDIPHEARVKRAFALDTARHLTLAGRYPRWAALPDRWISWLVGGVLAGWMQCRRERPTVLWSTYPIATAHLIGERLSRLTGLPWVADFRDPMVEHDARTGQDYPLDPQVRAAYLRVERKAAERAAAVVFCTRGAARIFRERYPQFPPARIHVIANGFDEAAFSTAPTPPAAAAPDGRIHLLHSGVLYPGPDRDPTHFLEAIRALVDAQPGWRLRLRITLRATGYDERYRPVIARLGLADLVSLAPVVPYREALAEMLSADALLVFQGYTSNPAVPAKVYEYFRAGQPILALVDAEGDTAALLRDEGVGRVLPIDDSAAIAHGLDEFLADLLTGRVPVMSRERARGFERGARARELAALFDTVAASTEVASPPAHSRAST